jgi:hypothetical protein
LSGNKGAEQQAAAKKVKHFSLTNKAEEHTWTSVVLL